MAEDLSNVYGWGQGLIKYPSYTGAVSPYTNTPNWNNTTEVSTTATSHVNHGGVHQPCAMCTPTPQTNLYELSQLALGLQAQLNNILPNAAQIQSWKDRLNAPARREYFPYPPVTDRAPVSSSKPATGYSGFIDNERRRVEDLERHRQQDIERMRRELWEGTIQLPVVEEMVRGARDGNTSAMQETIRERSFERIRQMVFSSDGTSDHSYGWPTQKPYEPRYVLKPNPVKGRKPWRLILRDEGYEKK